MVAADVASRSRILRDGPACKLEIFALAAAAAFDPDFTFIFFGLAGLTDPAGGLKFKKCTVYLPGVLTVASCVYICLISVFCVLKLLLIILFWKVDVASFLFINFTSSMVLSSMNLAMSMRLPFYLTQT